MKQRNRRKRISTILLAAAMMITTLPQLSTTALAADKPNKLQFATTEELKTFNTNDKDGERNPAKVYFGKNNNDEKQTWWITGNDLNSTNGTENLVLFAKSPNGEASLLGSAQFNADEENNKKDPTLWADCVYPTGINVTEVFPNHYGASDIRAVLKKMGTDPQYFSTFEQDVMNETQIFTLDLKCLYEDNHSLAESIYFTTDKLYLGYGGFYSDNGYDYFLVGTNGSGSRDELDRGLRVGEEYWGEWGQEDHWFWLRKAPENIINNKSSSAYFVGPLATAGAWSVTNEFEINPAFELNLSAVAFASAALPASKSGALTLENVHDDGEGAFTLRYKSDSIGSVQISSDKQTLELINVPTGEGVFLVIQDSTGAVAEELKGESSITATELGRKSFENCEVWLEKTDDAQRVTYGVRAKNEGEYSIKINKNNGLSNVINSEQIVADRNPITDIRIELEDGYYFSEDYLTRLNEVLKDTGLVAEKSDSGFVIKGIPVKDVNITLPEATAKTTPDAPKVTGGIGSTINDTDVTMEYAVSKDSDTWISCTDKSTEVGAGTWYVRYKETDTQYASLATEVVVIAPTYTIITDKNLIDLGAVNEGYENGSLSQTIVITNTGNSQVVLEKPVDSDYEVTLSNNEIAPGATATLTISPKTGLTAGDYNETIEIKTKQGTSTSVNVTFKVNGAFDVSLSASATEVIEGQPVTLTATAQGGSGTYSYAWYANDVEDGSLQGDTVSVTPTQTTTYKVVVTDTIENKTATATITVIPKNYDLEIPAEIVFDDWHSGYTDVAAKSVSIRNTGNVDVTNITVALGGTNSDAFTLDTTGMQNALVPNGTTMFIVKPNADLAAGTYTAELQIAGDGGITKTTAIRFTVEDHTYKAEWTSSETSHWHECQNCDSRSEEAEHTFSWIVDKEATTTEKGFKHEECSVCGYKKAGIEIPILPPMKPDNPNPDKPNPDKPNPDGTKPDADGTKPDADGTKPDTDGTKPDADGTKPDTDGTKPDADGTKPDTDGTKPDTDGTKPDADGTKPDADGTKPDTDGTKPDTDGTKPDADGTKPDADGTKPDADGNKPDADGSKPNVDGTKPNAEAGSPKTGDHTNISLYVSLLVMSGVVIVSFVAGIFLYKKQKKMKK